MNTTALIRTHGFVTVLVVLLVALLIAALRVAALPLAGAAVLLDQAANSAARSETFTNLATPMEGDTR